MHRAALVRRVRPVTPPAREAAAGAAQCVQAMRPARLQELPATVARTNSTLGTKERMASNHRSNECEDSSVRCNWGVNSPLGLPPLGRVLAGRDHKLRFRAYQLEVLVGRRAMCHGAELFGNSRDLRWRDKPA